MNQPASGFVVERRKPYAELLRDPRWQKKRLEVLSAASWRCEDCGRKDQTLEVHHCVYIPGRKPWEYEIDTLMALCSGCHDFRQGREDAFRLAIGKITRFLPAQQLESEVWKILGDVSERETERLAESFS